MSQAFREGWERVFGLRPPPKIVLCPFNLRRGLVIHVELPNDFCLRDLRRFVRYLATMCDDWEPEDGLPVLVCWEPEDGLPVLVWPDKKG